MTSTDDSYHTWLGTYQSAGDSVDHDTLREIHRVGYREYDQLGVASRWPVEQVIHDRLFARPQEVKLVGIHINRSQNAYLLLQRFMNFTFKMLQKIE